MAEDDSAPHEMGHLLGLLDKYKDCGDSSSTPYKNWDGNIMANGSEVNNKNIEEILKNAWKKYEIWKEKGGKGIFTYEINP